MLLMILTVIFASWIASKILRPLLPSTLDNIPGPLAQSWITGSLHQVISHRGWQFHRSIAETFGGIARIKGYFGANMLYVHDPKALYHILAKDQDIYEEHPGFIETSRLAFGEGILTSTGQHHRYHRKMINPAFSMSHLREMSHIFYKVGHKLRNTFVAQVEYGPQEVDIGSWMARLSLEMIGQVGFGCTFDALSEGSDPHPYDDAASQALLVASKSGVFALMIFVLPRIRYLIPARTMRWLLHILPIRTFRGFRDFIDVLHESSLKLYELKKKVLDAGDTALSEQTEQGEDILSILMKENTAGRLSTDGLLSHIRAYMAGGTDTVSRALSRTLHQLALHPAVQAAVRQEIQDARRANGGQDIDFDTLLALPLLDAIFRETLRLYPPVTTLIRTCRQDTILPLATPIKDANGKYIQEVAVPRDTDIFISILSSNTNAAFWGLDSYEWKPERWLRPLPEALVNAKVPGVYSHLMTFLGGGRSCIGFKFSEIEMKVVLAILLERLEFSTSDKNIVWSMAYITTPYIEGDEGFVSALPMIVRLAQC